MNNYLSEAFKKLDILDEDVFELDKDGLTALKDFEDSDEDDTITVVDPDAESEEDLEDSYIGKVILDCSVCHTDIYKDKEDITIDEESGLANIGEECPYCYSSDGFKVIGEVKPFVEVEVDTDEDDEEYDESLRRNRRLKESKWVQVNKSRNADRDYRYCGNGGRSWVRKDSKNIDTWDSEEEARADGKANYKKGFKWDVEKLEESCSINQCQKWVDYDMKKYKKISDDTMKKIKSSGYSVVKDQYGDYEVIADRKDESCGKRKSRKMEESIEDITIDTGEQEITVSAKDKEEIESDGEMIAPLSDEAKSDIETGSDDTVDVDVDEFSEEDFDELGESYLKKVYENVDGYKTTSAKTKGNKLYVEGLIKFNSGKQKKTSFVFESKTITKTGKAKLIGENLQISRGHKSFKLTGTINNGKFISESLNYNYRVKNGNSSQRVYGTAKKSK